MTGTLNRLHCLYRSLDVALLDIPMEKNLSLRCLALIPFQSLKQSVIYLARIGIYLPFISSAIVAILLRSLSRQ